MRIKIFLYYFRRGINLLLLQLQMQEKWLLAKLQEALLCWRWEGRQWHS